MKIHLSPISVCLHFLEIEKPSYNKAFRHFPEGCDENKSARNSILLRLIFKQRLLTGVGSPKRGKKALQRCLNIIGRGEQPFAPTQDWQVGTSLPR